MDAAHKKVLRALVLELRHGLEGEHTPDGTWQPGDLERRLAALGVRSDREPVPADELPHLSSQDRRARGVVDAWLALRRDAGVAHEDTVREFGRETAYTWANRLLALRCMEARGLSDEVVRQNDAYGGRSLEHHRLAQREPERCAGEDDGLFEVLQRAFAAQARRLPLLFDPRAPGVALRPSPAALKRAIRLLSGAVAPRGQEAATDEVFRAPDALGWAYQYWNTEAKSRVFARVKRDKAKIQGADIIPATQLYTEPYMVKFLVQNSLGATWAGMHPETRLTEGWEYYVRDADRAPVERKPVRELTFLDPACGSGHFLLEAFDLLYAMYEEEGELTEPAAICRAILEENLYGIDIDERAIQIAEAALWMKAAERAFDFPGARTNLVATNLRLPGGVDHLETFLRRHPEDRDLRPALEAVFQGLQHVDELGSLVRIEELVDRELQRLQERYAQRRITWAQPDMFRQTYVQAELPLGVESFDAWKGKTLADLEAHFAAEAESADLGAAFFGRAAERGLRLFELLSRRYDVVAANPPYMGSRNMGPVLKAYLQRHYESGKRDLYAAFLLRCVGLSLPAGHVAMVTQQSWLFLNTFEDLRACPDDRVDASIKGVLHTTVIEAIAHLGRYAFTEISNGAVAPVLVVVRASAVGAEHRLWAVRLSAPRPASKQSEMLRTSCTGESKQWTFRPKQSRFASVPGAPLCYWLSEELLGLFSKHLLSNAAGVVQGVSTSDGDRFVRYVWEVDSSRREDGASAGRWVPFEMGGGYGRWAGHCLWSVDWGHNGERIRAFDRAVIRNEEHYFRHGLVYTSAANGSLGVRYLAGSIWGAVQADAVFPKTIGRDTLAGVLNSRVPSAAVRWMNPQLALSVSYLARVPVPELPSAIVGAIARDCVALKSTLVSLDPSERCFGSQCELADRLALLGTLATLHALEGWSERLVFDAYALSTEDTAAVLAETGTPAGWHPLLPGYDALPNLPDGLPAPPAGLVEHLAAHERRELSPADLAALQSRLRALYEAGPGAAPDEQDSPAVSDEDGGEDEEAPAGACIPIPPETFLEELSLKLQVHPISVYWLLKQGIERDGWRCLPEERRVLEDRVTVQVLRLLGHRWPRQVEAGEPVPAWADRDGVIPLTPGTDEPALVERLRARLAADTADGDGRGFEREFVEVLGTPLERWLFTDFFAHHTSQFKKRPVAWQLQSGPFRRGRAPAFACLVYCQAVNGDTLPKIRSHYVVPLRQRMETELRGIEGIPEPSRTERQRLRRDELHERVAELAAFEERLVGVERAGFAAAGLPENALRDGIVKLTRDVLERLRAALVAAAAVGEWKAAGAPAGDGLTKALDEAVAGLPGRCGALAPAGMPAAGGATGPAEGHAAVTDAVAAIVRRALDGLRGAWDDAAKAWLKAAVAAVNEQNLGRRRVEELRNTRKALDEVGKAIAAWRPADLAEWGPWVGTLPLYDAVSSPRHGDPLPATPAEHAEGEARYFPDVNDGVRVNLAPLQKAGLLASNVLKAHDVETAIADRAVWRSDERRWCREGKLPRPGWWPGSETS